LRGLLQYYRENANYLERTYDFLERLGIEKVRKETVYAQPEVRQALLDRLHKSKDKSYDAWMERGAPTALTVRVNSTNRGNSGMNWIRMTEVENIPPREGRSLELGTRSLAVFNLGGSLCGDREQVSPQWRPARRRDWRRNHGHLSAAQLARLSGFRKRHQAL